MHSMQSKKGLIKNDRARRILLMIDEDTNSCVDKDDKRDCFEHADIIPIVSSTDTDDLPKSQGYDNDIVGQYFDAVEVAPIASTSTAIILNTLNRAPQNIYTGDNQERDEEFLTDYSEYIPSPEKNKSQSPQRNVSSLGGDFLTINKILTSEEISETPPIILNISMFFDNIDFVASPTVIYKATPICGTSTSDLQPIGDLSEFRSKTPINIPGNKSFDTDLNETLIPNKTTSCEGVIQFECSASEIVGHEVRNEITDISSNENHFIESDNTISLENNPSPNTSGKITRKRQVNRSEWFCNKNKKLKNSGQAYEGCNTKKKYPAKTIGPMCACKKKCGEKFSSAERKHVFDRYYNLADCEQQWLFISRYVENKPIKRLTLERKNNRTQTINYFFPLNNERIPVCKTFFLNSLVIGEQVVYTALEKVMTSEGGLKDKRGQHQNRPNKMKPATEASIKTHIELFPKVESHYTRQNSIRKYLAEDLNISKMYRLYTEWFQIQDFTDVTQATKRQYESVFNTQFNFSFFKPKKDQCLTCSIYNQAEPDHKAALEEKQKIHIDKKEKIRLLKKEEIDTADKNNSVVAIFDLQKVLSVPQSEVGTFHYKRKYPCYNFTVFDATRRIGHCYVWHYQIAKRGSSEIGSALLKYFKEQNAQGITDFSLYSDGCYGQNKNRYIFALYMYISKLLGVSITHRFFETGHSQNEGDSMHACIERNLRNKVLYTPEQIFGVILNSKVTGEKYRIHELQQADVSDLKELVDCKQWRLDKEGNIIRWADIMEVKVSNLEENKLFFRYNFDDTYLEFNLYNPLSKRRGRKHTRVTTTSLYNVQLKRAYNGPIPISKALHTDLTSLCTTGAIPRYYHAFYESLSFCETNDDQNLDNDEN